jgi:predicted ribosome quality control (RQC) complex YloA/Tae2 family protein
LAAFVAELSGLEVLVLAKEIESSLRGTYVKNVYSLGTTQLLRFGRAGSDDIWIVASSKLGVWVSQKVAERAETSEFTTRLRREIVRSRFISVAQVGLDRVFDMALGEGEHSRHLIVEVMPPGNIIVTDEGMKLLLCLNEVRSRSRRLVRGSSYSPPQQRRKSPLEVDESDVASALQREDTAGAAVGRNFSLPRKYVIEVLARVGVVEGAPATSLVGREKALADSMRELVREADTLPLPCICETPLGDELYVLAPRYFSPKSSAGTLSELCDTLFLRRLVSDAEEVDDASASKRRELEATILKLNSQQLELTAEASRVRELATKARVAPSFSAALSAMKSAGVRLFKEPASQEAVASSLYDRAKELEKQAADAARAIRDLSARRLAEGKPKRRIARPIQRRSQEWYEAFRWFVTSEGKLAVGGRDAQSNSALIRRHMDTNDTVFHADLFGSPFFVLKGGGKQTDRETAEVAQATVAFSSAWKTGLGSADAYWVDSGQVSLSAPSGEFLPKGGFLIKGKKNFVRHNRVELAVGIDTDGRALSGPESAIEKAAVAYVVVRPQKEKSSETAKRIVGDLVSLSKGSGWARVSVDDVLRMLPSGGGKVLRKYSSPTESTEPRNA